MASKDFLLLKPTATYHVKRIFLWKRLTFHVLIALLTTEKTTTMSVLHGLKNSTADLKKRKDGKTLSMNKTTVLLTLAQLQQQLSALCSPLPLDLQQTLSDIKQFILTSPTTLEPSSMAMVQGGP